ncbi:MAG: signal recognition particle-docking protein FtsY, partial [Spirulinaceae cyanobacterium]
RQYKDKGKEQETQKTESTPSETQESVEEKTQESSEPSQEDYLQWAKAAYQNIQQRQSQEVEEESVETVAEEETESSETVAETVTEEESVEPVAEQGTETSETVAEEEIESSEPVAETVVEEASVEPVTEQETEAETTKPVPVWMRKSDGLERLKETAVDIEDTPDRPIRTASQQESEVAFDEDFMWSAQVLASQGRNPEEISAEEIQWLKKLRQGLGKTRRSLINQLKSVVGQGPLNQAAVTEIEELLLQADVGFEATDFIIETLQNKLKEEALPPEAAIAYLKQIIQDLLDKPLQALETEEFVPEKNILNVWLLTGVNGAGKTTTIGKLAHMAQSSGYSCIIAAADTFRAAAVEQVKVWGERSNTPVIANPGQNTDPAAVVFDAITAAQSKNTELLLVDTAGRLQNKKNLMDELAKVRRIIDKKAPGAKVESLLVLDATLGQNGLRQAQVFSEAAKLSGVVLTKLDGTAKGGVALAVVQQLNLPIRFVGAGEGIEDLRPFSSYEFVEALISG